MSDEIVIAGINTYSWRCRRGWCVYLIEDTVRPADGEPRKGSRSLYVGMTNALEHRVSAHNKGEVTATKGRAWKLVGVCPCPTRIVASQLERYLKCGDSRQKRDYFRNTFKPDALPNTVHITQELRQAAGWDMARKARETATQINFDFEQSGEQPNGDTALATHTRRGRHTTKPQRTGA